LRRQTDETLDAMFFPMDALPSPLARGVEQAIRDLARFEASNRFVLG
jgi:hypothetical protein